MSFKNLAAHDEAEAHCRSELVLAQIEIQHLPLPIKGEVPTRVIGQVGPWGFQRAWRYWIAEGPGLPLGVADALHEEHGRVVRVQGHCGAPSPSEYLGGFACGLYHVDTQEGLNALAKAVRDVVKGETSWRWSDQPPTEPGWYQVAHVKAGTWIVQVRKNSERLWVGLPGGGVKEPHGLPWIWGPRIPLADVPGDVAELVDAPDSSPGGPERP